VQKVILFSCFCNGQGRHGKQKLECTSAHQLVLMVCLS